MKAELQALASSVNTLQQQIGDIRNEEQLLMTEQIQNHGELNRMHVHVQYSAK